MSCRNILSRLWIKITARPVGRDQGGNTYYAGGQRRWVIYAGRPEATKVPAPWFLWLHRISDEIPDGAVAAVTPNRTGTPWAYRPRHAQWWLAKREAGVDYQAWRPE